ncbi:alpha/beta fold hydrolase [Emcibacter nanhaiensis]|uniref:Alpha/beta hydrolase n=1 Tax=Emcibacter nanhaiensis TaxID=1505037 RepID=A0A501PKD6_9PROT|nr:alpha/beta hydrolase [Emcibacter nanhaiensis]TPD60176.1 alpha/beta hydrolase [Emcibacter nanhaiensis]
MNSIHVDLLGTETRFYDTGKYRTRTIEVVNDKQPLFLLHGGGGHAETYSRNMVALSKSSHPYAIDFIWHGMSSRPDFSKAGPNDKDHWLSQFTDQLLNLMDHLGIEKASVEGESLGGWIAMDMAINHPDRTEKVILNTAWGMSFDPSKVHEGDHDLDALRETSVNALMNPTPELLRKRLEWLMPLGGVTDELVQLRYALWSIPETRDALLKYYDYLFAPNIAEFYFTEEDFPKIECPALVLWSDKNPIHGVDAADRLAELIPNSQKHIMEGCAHWPQWERPEEHDEVVNAFLAS